MRRCEKPAIHIQDEHSSFFPWEAMTLAIDDAAFIAEDVETYAKEWKPSLWRPNT